MDLNFTKNDISDALKFNAESSFHFSQIQQMSEPSDIEYFFMNVVCVHFKIKSKLMVTN